MKYRLYLLVLSVIPIYVLIESAGFKRRASDVSGGPGGFPSFIAALMLILIIVQLIRTFWQPSKKVVFLELFTGKTGFFLGAFVVYIVLLNFVGFLIATIIYLPITSLYLKYKTYGAIPKKQMIKETIILVVFAIGLYFFFNELINVRMPTGELF